MDHLTRKREFAHAIFRYGLMLGLTCGLSGCGGDNGPKRGAIRGTVSFDGELIDQGSILFLPTGGTKGPSSGAGIINGQFSIPESKGPVVGLHRVEVHWPRRTGKRVEVASPAPQGTFMDEISEGIPSAFNTESKLQQRVEPGENEIVIELMSEAVAATENKSNTE